MKKGIAVLLMIVMLVSALTGCGGGGGSDSSSQAASQTQSQNDVSGNEESLGVSEDAPFVITTLASFFEQEPPSTTNNPVFDFVQEKLNVEIQVTWTPNGEAMTKFNTMMAGDNALMVMGGADVSSSNYIRMCQTGAFWDITDIIKDYPFITDTLMSDVQRDTSLTEGRRYCIPSYVPDARIAMVYRVDWVENLGIELPEVMSAQDYYDLAKAFTEQDPDQNGVDDTTGFNYVDDQDKEVNYGFNTLAVACGAPNRYGVRDGQVVAYFQTEEYMNCLRMMHDMYENGYLNSEFMTLGSGAKYNPMLEGRAGFMFTTATNAVTPGGKFDTLLANDPDAVIGYKMLSLDPNGNKVVNSNITGVSGGNVFPVSAVKSEEDLRKILQFMVDLNQGDCAKALDIGIEGIHYTTDADGTINITDEQRELRDSDGSGSIFANMFARRLMADDWGQPLSDYDKIQQHYAENAQYAVPDISVGMLSSENIQKENELASLIYDARAQFIMGFIDEAAFQAAVDTWLSSGGQAILDEIQENYVTE